MDTTAARIAMRDFGRQGQEVLRLFLSADVSRAASAEECRRLMDQSRALLADAGYPGEAVWSGLRRSASGLDAMIDASDTAYWADLLQDLADAIDVLDSLVASPAGRDVDFRIIG